MKQLEERLHSDLAAAVDAAESRGLSIPDINDVMTSVRRQERRRRIRYAAVVAAVALPFTAIGYLTIARDGDDASPVVKPSPETTTQTSAETPTTIPDTTATTGSTMPPAGAAPEAPVGGEVVLTADGVGVAHFGDPADQVVAAVSARLGPPTEDITASNEMCVFNECSPECAAVTVQRIASWTHFQLEFFGPSAESLTFYGWWVVQGSDLATELGRRAGDPISAWSETYGDNASFTYRRDPASGQSIGTVRVALPTGDLGGYTNSGTPPTIVRILEAGTKCDTAP